MNDEPNNNSSNKPHTATWSLLSVVMVPVLYVLLTPPILCAAIKFGGVPASGPPPQWIRAWVVPYQWLMTNSPVQEAVHGYFEWWWSRMGPSTP